MKSLSRNFIQVSVLVSKVTVSTTSLVIGCDKHDNAYSGQGFLENSEVEESQETESRNECGLS